MKNLLTLCLILTTLLFSNCNGRNKLTKTKTDKDSTSVVEVDNKTKITETTIDTNLVIKGDTANVEADVKALQDGDSSVVKDNGVTVITKIVKGKVKTKVITSTKVIPVHAKKVITESETKSKTQTHVKTKTKTIEKPARTIPWWWWLLGVIAVLFFILVKGWRAYNRQ